MYYNSFVVRTSELQLIIMYEVSYHGRPSCVRNYFLFDWKNCLYDAERDLLAIAELLVLFTVVSTCLQMSMIVVPLPDAPMGVQVEAGPQRGTLLVMWTPVADKKPVDEETAALMCAITGYTVYVDGTLVKQLDSPSGQPEIIGPYATESIE